MDYDRCRKIGQSKTSVSDTDETPPLTRKSLRESAGRVTTNDLGIRRRAAPWKAARRARKVDLSRISCGMRRKKPDVHHCGVSTPHTNKRATIRPSKAHEDDVPDQRDSSVIATGTITRYGLVNSQVLSAFPEDTERRQPFAVFEDDIEILSSIRGKRCEVRVAISQSVRVLWKYGRRADEGKRRDHKIGGELHESMLLTWLIFLTGHRWFTIVEGCASRERGEGGRVVGLLNVLLEILRVTNDKGHCACFV
ncbi:hypothetical protein B0H13DRAFT_1914100 [Mycena leptocephala]|nr:hypothetical protein B0H13DRAFT_1914100 [Mycena leptocephala]